MRIIPVLDLARGIAVHARGGDRERYEPVRSSVVPEAAGDPVALLRAYHEALGVDECYVADLDAIGGGAPQTEAFQRLRDPDTGFAGRLLVDAGTSSLEAAEAVLAGGASQVVVALETLRDFADLAAVVERIGPLRTIFGLDLRFGNPILHPALRDAGYNGRDPMSLAARAVVAGARSMLVLDLGRIGTGDGVDLGLLRSLRRHFPNERLLAGGGVRHRRDLERIRDIGCDAALVASAIHEGRITREDVASLVEPPPVPVSRR
jgi:phosphoribosylformimino-5-aminoimidazole carboxamide ribotide isomerase